MAGHRPSEWIRDNVLSWLLRPDCTLEVRILPGNLYAACDALEERVRGGARVLVLHEPEWTDARRCFSEPNVRFSSRLRDACDLGGVDAVYLWRLSDLTLSNLIAEGLIDVVRQLYAQES